MGVAIFRRHTLISCSVSTTYEEKTDAVKHEATHAAAAEVVVYSEADPDSSLADEAAEPPDSSFFSYWIIKKKKVFKKRIDKSPTDDIEQGEQINLAWSC